MKAEVAPPPAHHRRWRQRGHAPASLAGEALARAYAEDALVTKHLNEAAMDRLGRDDQDRLPQL